ncbi:MAG: DJ-1/PfpI family protein [Pseudomonadota bacterium]
MPNSKKLAIVLIDGFADWEYPLLAASARQWFGIDTRFFTPSGEPVTSIAGLMFRDGAPFSLIDLDSGDALAVIGSDNWAAASAPDISQYLATCIENEVIIGGICAGTLPLAKAGMFANHHHTSNSRDWIMENAGNYAGAENYQDRPYAVRQNRVVSAPGSAPGTFAVEMLNAMLPDQTEQIGEMKNMFANEFLAGANQ